VRPGRLRGETQGAGEAPLFQISQRADYIQNDFFEWVQHNRAIINTRDEPLADPRQYRRLHLIHGDTSVLPSSLFLKIGTTRLVLDLLDADDLPPVALADAVSTLRGLSRRTRPPWTANLADGTTVDALEVLELYRLRANAAFRGRDAETDAVLDLWQRTQAGLASNPESQVGILDWVTKEYLLRAFCESEGLDWSHPWLEAQDLEFHQIHPEKGLGLALANLDGYWNPPRVDLACTDPPQDSRAHARSRLMREIAGKDTSYFLDWEAVEVPNVSRNRLLDPFQT
jgi:proteasome accessory factor A